MSTAKHGAAMIVPLTVAFWWMNRKASPDAMAMPAESGRATYLSTGHVSSGNSKTSRSTAKRRRNFQRGDIIARHPDRERSEGEGSQTSQPEILRRLRGSG